MHKDLKNLWLPYTQMKAVKEIPKAVKTEKSKIYLNNNTFLIDGISSWWTACHGYNNKYINKKVKKQLDTMPHIMFGGLIHDQAVKLSKRLASLLNNKLEKVFFSDSGSVAIEVALKMSIQYWLNQKYKNKNKFIFFKNGYHGDTSGAMSVCDPEEGMHFLFKNYLNKNYMLDLPANDNAKKKFDLFLKKNEKKIAGIIIEPLVQAAGGMKFHSTSTLEFIHKLSNKYNTLLIFDEIATGFFRTGSMFAFQKSNAFPDILCIGKALTGGVMSLAATLSTKKVFNVFLSSQSDKELMHGPTYMANPLACSAANASMDLFEKKKYNLIVNKIEKTLKSELKKFKQFNFIKQIRVIGAIGVLELNSLKKEENQWLKLQFIKKGIWLRPFKNIVYFMPPLIISKNELKKLIESTFVIFQNWKKDE